MTDKGKTTQTGSAAAPFEDATQKRLGRTFAILERICLGATWASVELVALRLKFPADENGECLVVLTGYDGNGAPVVAFHTAVSATEAVVGAINRFQNGTLKWKEDEYRK